MIGKKLILPTFQPDAPVLLKARGGLDAVLLQMGTKHLQVKHGVFNAVLEAGARELDRQEYKFIGW